MRSSRVRRAIVAGLMAMAAASSGGHGQPLPAAPAGPPNLLSYEVMLVGGARDGQRLPMLVALHWYGARPEALHAWLRGIGEPARIILPRGRYPQGAGLAWWPEERERELGAAGAIAAAADEVARTIVHARRRFATSGRVTVTGLSHGGDIGFALAMRHRGLVGAAIPIAARLPEELWPDRSVGVMPRIDLFQGETDAIVPMRDTIAAVSELRRRGVPIVLHYVPGIGHAFPAALQADARDRIEARLRSAARER